MKKILIIQTAFIGDVVLATGVIEKLGTYFPDSKIDFLLRSGNESLLANNPYINEILTWNKKEKKLRNLFAMIRMIRERRYDRVINLQRFFSTGLITVLSRARYTSGFNKNPLSFLFSNKVKHIISTDYPINQESYRNNDLVEDFTDGLIYLPILYPSPADYEIVKQYVSGVYVTMSPSSVWFTKKYPFEKWLELLNAFPDRYTVYLLGGADDVEECERLVAQTVNKKVVPLAGRLSFLQSAALMKRAVTNYTNDSAPLHFGSAMNASVTAIFCSTIPAFGFGPTSQKSFTIQTTEALTCRPCGLHGKNSCPKSHFKCAYGIEVNQLLAILPA